MEEINNVFVIPLEVLSIMTKDILILPSYITILLEDFMSTIKDTMTNSKDFMNPKVFTIGQKIS